MLSQNRKYILQNIIEQNRVIETNYNEELNKKCTL